MTRAIRSSALLLGLALVLQPMEPLAAMEIPAALEIARGGGGHGGGHGGGGRAASRGGSGARTGFASFSGGSNRSSLRLDSRPAERSGRVDTRQGNRKERTDLRQSNRSERVNDRNRTRRQAISTWDRNRPNWVNRNWDVNRPWRYGWYGGSYWNNWGWWPGRAAAWGLGTLATFAVIDSLVDSAVNSQTSYIVVPDSDYSLYYSSVQASGDLVSFQADDGSNTNTFRADCRSGTLNGYPPQNADEAQLLNAACQVAFGQ
jgi:hypothetical protein